LKNEKDGLSADRLESIKNQLENYTRSRDEFVCKKYGITYSILEEWLTLEKNDP
jgi:hypothetical protein